MELEEIRKKYQCDEGRTFAQWKEWVRKNKPSQAETHIVTAVAPNGSKFEKLIGGYTDAQNNAFDLVAHGYKNVKMFKSVNAGPMKLLRNFSAPLHGAKFKDEADAVDAIREKYQSDAMVSKSELEKKKYTQFFVNGEDINGKVLRIPQRRFKKFEEAVRVAKSFQNANTRHVFVEGGWDNNQVEPKALYDWRNPKAK